MRDLPNEIRLTESKLQLLYDLREAKIRTAHKAGLPVAQIASYYGVSRQRIWQILATK